MPVSNSFQCPYCLHHTVAEVHKTVRQGTITLLESVHGKTRVSLTSQVCGNAACRKLTLSGWLQVYEDLGANRIKILEQLNFWRLLPDSTAMPQPDYIPQAIRDDYEEACKIRNLSPKASATLSRRCLQGMIRDFWKIRKKNLAQAINALKPEVDGTTWKAIEAVRKVGNIGAHMEKNIDLIVEVEPKEAGLLIGLIERLFREWYVARHERQQSMDALIEMAEGKEKARKGQAAEPQATAEPAEPQAAEPN